MKWIFLAVGGLVLNGAGLSVFGDAVLKKMSHPDELGAWFWEGTLSLILINAGICCVVEAAAANRSRNKNKT